MGTLLASKTSSRGKDKVPSTLLYHMSLLTNKVPAPSDSERRVRTLGTVSLFPVAVVGHGSRVDMPHSPELSLLCVYILGYN